jgi:hypothetical protein
VVKETFKASMARFRAVFASLSAFELAELTALLQRFREGFTEVNEPARSKDSMVALLHRNRREARGAQGRD